MYFHGYEISLKIVFLKKRKRKCPHAFKKINKIKLLYFNVDDSKTWDL